MSTAELISPTTTTTTSSSFTNEKSFDELLKEKLNRSKNNNRKQSNKRFYMLFLSYKIMKKILQNPNIQERDLKLVNSNFSRILLSILEKEDLIQSKTGHKNVFELTIEGVTFTDFIDSYLKRLGYNSYDEKSINDDLDF